MLEKKVMYSINVKIRNRYLFSFAVMNHMCVDPTSELVLALTP